MIMDLKVYCVLCEFSQPTTQYNTQCNETPDKVQTWVGNVCQYMYIYFHFTREIPCGGGSKGGRVHGARPRIAAFEYKKKSV